MPPSFREGGTGVRLFNANAVTTNSPFLLFQKNFVLLHFTKTE
ncbi:hypothetical protein HMPREF9072_00651 [Capnocytophaga sp. oral taxon 324 str. F0483]|nr:hypothetical protein HMPREF9072_00651 [Capnocytophaga sp. oral taxon 324 str. F0483]